MDRVERFVKLSRGKCLPHLSVGSLNDGDGDDDVGVSGSLCRLWVIAVPWHEMECTKVLRS
jgi:hypothetical protein